MQLSACLNHFALVLFVEARAHLFACDCFKTKTRKHRFLLAHETQHI